MSKINFLKIIKYYFKTFNSKIFLKKPMNPTTTVRIPNKI